MTSGNEAPIAANDSQAPSSAEENAAQPDAGEKIAALEAEIAALKDQRIRALAEADNIRKRGARELEESGKYAVTKFAGDMVSVLENLKRAAETLNGAQGNDLVKTVAEGVNLTLQELLGIFERYGITRIDPAGQKFDHNFHQAVAQVENADMEPGMVVHVVQAGYRIHDRLLKPAMVTVSKKPEAPKPVDVSA